MSLASPHRFRPPDPRVFLTNRPNARFPTRSTSDPHFHPFWDPRLLSQYKTHLLPRCRQHVERDNQSWFSMKRYELDSTSRSPVTQHYEMENSDPKPPSINPQLVQKIRVFPTSQQKLKLAQMAGTARFVYNHVTAMIRDKRIPFETSAARSAKIIARERSHEAQGKTGEYKETAHPWLNFQYMRNFLVNNQSEFVTSHPWMKETPNAVRQIAVKEGIANYKAALSNLRQGHIKHFDAPFRAKSNRAWSIGFDPTQLHSNRLLPGGDFGYLKVAEPRLLQGRYKSQFRITRDKYKRYFLILVKDVLGQPSHASISLPTIAIDPGIRTRHALYSTCNGGEVIEIGSGDIQRIVRLAKFVDKKISESHAATCNHQRRRRLLRQRLKLTSRIADLKKELDYKTIRYLETNASQVLLPAFEVHTMACRLRHKQARALLCWGHGLFKQRLLDRASRSALKRDDCVGTLHEQDMRRVWLYR